LCYVCRTVRTKVKARTMRTQTQVRNKYRDRTKNKFSVPECTFHLFNQTLFYDSLQAGRSGYRIPVEAIFRTRPYRPWVTPSLRYYGYRVSLPGG
jgi:hypothetical protein